MCIQLLEATVAVKFVYPVVSRCFFLLLVYMQNSKLAMLIWNCMSRPATFVQLSLSDVSRCDVESQHHVGVDRCIIVNLFEFV